MNYNVNSSLKIVFSYIRNTPVSKDRGNKVTIYHRILFLTVFHQRHSYKHITSKFKSLLLLEKSNVEGQKVFTYLEYYFFNGL